MKCLGMLEQNLSPFSVFHLSFLPYATTCETGSYNIVDDVNL